MTTGCFYWEDMEGQPMDTPFAINDGDDHNGGRLIYQMEHRIDDYARFHEAKKRMAAAGWDVPSVKTDAGSTEFAATRDGFTVDASAILTMLGGSALLLSLLCGVLPMLKRRITYPTKQSTG